MNWLEESELRFHLDLRTAENITAGSRLAISHPVIPETAQPAEGFPILRAIRGNLAGDDVVRMADRKPVHHHTVAPGILEPLDPIGRKDQVQIERAVFQLDKILSALDLAGFRFGEQEAQFAQSRRQSASVARRAVWEYVRVLRRVGKAKNDGARFSDEEIA